MRAELGITFTLDEGCWQRLCRDVGQDQMDAGQDHLKAVGAVIRRRLPATSKPKMPINIGIKPKTLTKVKARTLARANPSNSKLKTMAGLTTKSQQLPQGGGPEQSQRYWLPPVPGFRVGWKHRGQS